MGASVTLEGQLMFPSEYLASADLGGKDVTVEIEAVKLADLQMVGGRKSKKPLLFFKGAKKKLVLNKTNAVLIADLHGPEASSWVGKKITLYPTKTGFAGKQVDCIRVREVLP